MNIILQSNTSIFQSSIRFSLFGSHNNYTWNLASRGTYFIFYYIFDENTT